MTTLLWIAAAIATVLAIDVIIGTYKSMMLRRRIRWYC